MAAVGADIFPRLIHARQRSNFRTCTGGVDLNRGCGDKRNAARPVWAGSTASGGGIGDEGRRRDGAAGD